MDQASYLPVPAWKILIVDDEVDIHQVTEFALKHEIIDQRGIEFLHAYSISQAQAILTSHTNIALVLLDVIMETRDAGLQLINYIRNTLHNYTIRIVIRTGHTDIFPERDFFVQYDINDFYSKTELVGDRLFILTYSSLRSYQQLIDIQKKTLEKQEADEAKEAALQANQHKTYFLASVSHEIRTPLNAIMGYTQLLIKSPHLPAKESQTAQIIKDNTDHLTTLLNEVLDLSKIESGKMHLSPTAVNLSTLLQQLSDLFQLSCEEKGIQWKTTVSLHHSEQYVLADEKKLRQILINLIGNAIKFTEQGSIELSCTQLATQYYQFDVIDTGKGIPETIQSKIFQPFVQEQQQPGSTGLGLALSRQFTQLMGGELIVSSKVNKGSHFSFQLTLPSADIQDHNAIPKTSSPAQVVSSDTTLATSSPDGYCIAIVDDNMINRQILLEILQDINIPSPLHIIEAENGKEAVDLCLQHQPDLIFMDYRMPDLNGIQVLQQLQQHQPKVKAIMLTASAFINDKIQFLDAGFIDVINKPFFIDQIKESLHTHLFTGIASITSDKNTPS